MTQIETHEIRLERTIKAPLERVRKALLDPALLAQWFAPGPMEATVHACDAVVGGHYEIAMTGPGPDGAIGTHSCTGVFQEIGATHIAMTFNWTQEPLPNDTTLRYELSEVDGGTKLILLHTGLPNAEAVAMHTQGWEGCLAKLPNVV